MPGKMIGFSIVDRKTRICTFPTCFVVDSARFGGADFGALTGTLDGMWEAPFE
jgi:hypothetical protein